MLRLPCHPMSCHNNLAIDMCGTVELFMARLLTTRLEASAAEMANKFGSKLKVLVQELLAGTRIKGTWWH